MMGAVLQTVNVRLPQPQIAYTLQHANAEILLVHRDFFPIVDALLPSLPAIKAVIAIMDGARGPIPDWDQGAYETLSAGASANYPFAAFDENAVARSEERRVGKACVSTCSSRWSPYTYKTTNFTPTK